VAAIRDEFYVGCGFSSTWRCKRLAWMDDFDGSWRCVWSWLCHASLRALPCARM